MAAAPDPVRRRRALVARWAAAGKRLGYALMLLAMVIFAAGLLTTFSEAVAAAVITCLIAGSLILAPAIILAYATKAAERADRERGL